MKGMEHLRRKSHRQGSPPKEIVTTGMDEEQQQQQVNVLPPTSPSKKRILSPSRRTLRILLVWTLRLSVAFYVVHQIVFYVRYWTMSRPAFLYGTPMTTTTNDCWLEHPHTQSELPKVLWEWQRYSQTHTTNNSTITPKKKLLIAQYSGFGKYSELLDWIAPVNKAYAKHWGHDFVVLQGTAMPFSHISETCDDAPRATFNKIPLLELVVDMDEYEYVLILDTDAMIVTSTSTSNPSSPHDNPYPHHNSVDITTLLPDTHLLAAHRVWKYDWRNTWDINAGVMLWNVKHPTFPTVLAQWKQSVQDHQPLVLERNDDQYFLQSTLLQLGYWNRWVYSLNRGEFEYYKATIIKHFKRDARSWATNGLDQRVARIQESIQQDVCRPGNTNGIPKCRLEPRVDYSQHDRPVRSMPAMVGSGAFERRRG